MSWISTIISTHFIPGLPYRGKQLYSGKFPYSGKYTYREICFHPFKASIRKFGKHRQRKQYIVKYINYTPMELIHIC